MGASACEQEIEQVDIESAGLEGDVEWRRITRQEPSGKWINR